MKLKTLMIAKAVVCLFLGTAILAFPEALYQFFGITLGTGGVFTAREYGAALIGNLLITWFARNAVHSDARQAIVLGLFVYDAIGFVISLAGVLAGQINPLGWLVVALYLFLAIGFGYFYFAAPEQELSVSTA